MDLYKPQDKHLLVKLTLSLIPGVGQVAETLYDHIISRKAEENSVNMINSLKKDVSVLKQDISLLQNYPDSVIEQAKNYILEKSDKVPNMDVWKKIFTRLLLQMTEWHLALLIFFDDPQLFALVNNKEFDNVYIGNIEIHVKKIFPEIDDAAYQYIHKEFSAWGLIDGVTGTTTGRTTTESKTTPLGKKLLQWLLTDQ